MAESHPKRLREETKEYYSNLEFEFDDSVESVEDSVPNSKRQKPIHNILSLLDEDFEPAPASAPAPEPSQDLSEIYTTLQRELSSDSTTTFDFESLPSTAAEEVAEPPQHHGESVAGSGELDESVKSVMRHLLEASDDELGIPNRGDENGADVSSDEIFPFGFPENGLWDLEDEAANYYTVLQSELFM